MKELLEKMLKKIVTKPEAVVVEESGVQLLVSVDPQDVGVVIGKEGRNIKALRNLINLKGAKQSLPRYEIKVNAP